MYDIAIKDKGRMYLPQCIHDLYAMGDLAIEYLQVYLEANLDMEEAARILNISVVAFQKEIVKIENICGLDLSSIKTLFNVQAGLMILSSSTIQTQHAKKIKKKRL